MNEIETMIWALAYAAAVSAHEKDPKNVADLAVFDFSISCKERSKSNGD